MRWRVVYPVMRSVEALGQQDRHKDAHWVFRALSMEPDSRSLVSGGDSVWPPRQMPRVVEIADGATLSAFSGPNAINQSERAVFHGGLLMCLTFSGLQASRIGSHAVDLSGAESCVSLMATHPVELTSIGTSEPTRRTIAAFLSADALERFGVDLSAWGEGRQERVCQFGVTAAARALALDLLGGDGGHAQVVRLRAEALTLELLAGLAEQSERGNRNVSSPQPVPGRRRQAVDRARDVMAADPAAHHTLASIARAAGLSISALKRDFQQEFDISPIGFLRERRLQLGRALIERDGHSVAAAAYACGYDHPGNFAQAFRRRFGMTPSQLRR